MDVEDSSTIGNEEGEVDWAFFEERTASCMSDSTGQGRAITPWVAKQGLVELLDRC